VLIRPPSTQASTASDALNPDVDTTPSSLIERQPGKTYRLLAPMRCSAVMTVTTDLHVGPDCHPFIPPSIPGEACTNIPRDPNPTRPPFTQASTMPDVPVLDTDPTPSPRILQDHPGSPWPVQPPTTHVPASDNTCYSNSEDHSEYDTFVKIRCRCDFLFTLAIIYQLFSIQFCELDSMM
jgi:hypothetical protein